MTHPLFELSGRRALVTGGASGIGYAVAEGLVASGAEVVIADIADCSEAAAALGGHAVRMDVSDEPGVRGGFEESQVLLGGDLDIVILNAGVGDVGPTLAETDEALIEKVTRINQLGVLYGLKHAPGRMNDDGAIVATSSMAAHISIPGNGVYAATKRAVTSLVETAAMELGPRGIRVNAISPGYTDTAMGSGDEGRRMAETFTALGRMATVEDLVGVFLFLVSDAARYMTGQTLMVDGGWECGLTGRLLELVTGSSVAPG